MLTLFGVLLGWPVVFGAGLIVGWFLLPAPKFVQNLWAKLGLVDRVP